MTKTRILAAAVVFSIVPIAVGAAFRGVYPVVPEPAAGAPPPSAEIDFDERWIPVAKGDRLPFPTPTPTPTPVAVAAVPSEVAPPAASSPEELPLATDDDMAQAEAEHHHHEVEHHRHYGICRRTYFTFHHHQHWRCNR